MKLEFRSWRERDSSVASTRTVALRHERAEADAHRGHPEDAIEDGRVPLRPIRDQDGRSTRASRRCSTRYSRTASAWSPPGPDRPRSVFKFRISASAVARAAPHCSSHGTRSTRRVPARLLGRPGAGREARSRSRRTSSPRVRGGQAALIYGTAVLGTGRSTRSGRSATAWA